ncbi:hypothetical protein NX773_19530 [Massilia solisilvae]|uniref:DUF1090 family protein n=1 Tax=Massilia solisilvae TaxID=1811225 RepID=A0ABT2BPC8_9BURK|nr:hypothetical protein [Massilia solisilvae]MCS0610362.1 hypothetical protein [Massilia solisilvae]
MIRKIFFACSLMLALDLRATEAFPRDVQKFIDDREGCDHMRGEEPEPGDRQRARELKREMDRLCKGTDRKLAQLKKKYAASAIVMKRLGEFDPQIEAAVPEK